MIDVNVRGIGGLAAKGVAAATNVMMTFPEGRRRITHHKEHTIGEIVHLKSIHDCPEVSPGFHHTEADEGVESPFGFIRGMEIKGP